ncbi:MAG: hypothetical protein IJS34_02505 [Alphaproteobacteria bacterium]|nr:hypothetical protein [Alphaproteobacteria bacterium]
MSLKKLLLALPVLMTGFAIDATAATYGCKSGELSKELFKDRDTSVSFLYASEQQKLKYVGVACGHNGTFGCNRGGAALMPAGHYYGGNRIDAPTYYLCDNNGYNTWYAKRLDDIKTCDPGSIWNKYYSFAQIGDYHYFCTNKYTSGSCTGNSSSDICRMTEKHYNCEKSRGTYDPQTKKCTCEKGYKEGEGGRCEKDINNLDDQNKCAKIGGTWSNGVCNCPNGEYYDQKDKHCKAKNECKGDSICNSQVIVLSDIGNTNVSVHGGNVSDSGNSSNTNTNENNNNSKNTNGNNAGGKSGGGSGSGGSSCLDRPTAEGRACCRAKGATKWKDNVCTCVDTTKEWKYTEGQEYGSCVTKGSTEVINPCDAICTNYVSIVVDNCAMQKVNNYENVKAEIEQQCKYNRANCNPGTVGQWVNQIEVAVASCANQPVEPEKPQLNEQRLAAAVEAIDKYRSGLDVSVWKDAEGNFNTARLVSDSIAGVVLGTAGGLITSSVVKKNQVKNGFEDVVCTIGGQTVGSYGDEISVGIK